MKPKELEPHFAALNRIHAEAAYDLPCVGPTPRAAFNGAFRPPDLPLFRPPPERRSPVHPAWVVAMIAVACAPGVDRCVQRACVFTVLKYAAIGRSCVHPLVQHGDLKVLLFFRFVFAFFVLFYVRRRCLSS